MKKVVIKDNGLNITKLQVPMYGSERPFLGFVSKKDELVGRLMTCKDYLHEIIRTAHEGALKGAYNPHGYDPLKHPKLSFNELRFLFCHTGTKDQVIKKASKGLFILNKLEEYAGFKKTTAEFVNVKINGRQGILLKGSKIYMKNPHLLALAVLVMRFNFMVDIDISNANTAFDVTNAMYDKAKQMDLITKYGSDDRSMVKVTSRYMPYILKRRRSIFKGLTEEMLFRKNEMNNRHGFHSSGGIFSLVNCCTSIDVLNNRVRKMKEKLDFKN